MSDDRLKRLTNAAVIVARLDTITDLIRAVERDAQMHKIDDRMLGVLIAARCVIREARAEYMSRYMDAHKELEEEE